MKILLPYRIPHDRKIDDYSVPVQGGGEMFYRSIYENFNVETYQIPFDIVNFDFHEKKKIAKNIIERADEINADVIISNGSHAIDNGSEIAKSHIPVMSIVHEVFMFPSIISRLNNLHLKGHSVFLVSEWQLERYNDKIRRLQKTRTEFDYLNISGYINSDYCKHKVDLLDIEYECGTIGRCNREKRPFLLKQLLKDTDIKNLVITNTPTTKWDNSYYKKHKEYDDVLWDLPHNEVMTNLSKCGSYFSTWDKETYGITALESLSCGVPVILNSFKDGTHASEIIPVSKEHYKVIPKDDKDALISAIKSFKGIDREEIKEMTWEKHNLDSWKTHFENCIDKTVEKFKSKNNNLKEFMNGEIHGKM